VNSDPRVKPARIWRPRPIRSPQHAPRLGRQCCSTHPRALSLSRHYRGRFSSLSSTYAFSRGGGGSAVKCAKPPSRKCRYDSPGGRRPATRRAANFARGSVAGPRRIRTRRKRPVSLVKRVIGFDKYHPIAREKELLTFRDHHGRNNRASAARVFITTGGSLRIKIRCHLASSFMRVKCVRARDARSIISALSRGIFRLYFPPANYTGSAG